jgi:nucleotide-binding universal stress UspA family protein
VLEDEKLVAIKKILAAIDISESKEKIIEYAISLGKGGGSEITAIHVIDPGLDVSDGRVKEKERAEHLLNEIDLFAKKKGANIKKEVVEESDSVSKAIISYAKKNNMDVIVIGTKGMTAVKDFFLGSVANNVIHHAHCPVFAIR